MLQTFLALMYHAFPFFVVVDLAIALAASIPIVKLHHAKSNADSKKKPPFWGIVTCAIVLFAATVVLISGCVNQILCTQTPDIVGKTISNADLILERHELNLEQLPSLLENDAIITKQFPEEGMIVRKGSPVTIEYEVKENSRPEPKPTPESDWTEFSVSASINIIQIPLTNKNADINAYTNIEASHVTVSAVSETNPFGPYDMRTNDYKNWTFPANFYIDGTYTVTVIAYLEDGTAAEDSFSTTYPFPNPSF
jgi:hypothetical protein